MRIFTLPWSFALLPFLASGPSPASAQSLYGLSGPTGTVVQFTGPPGGACGYPNGPIVSAFPYAVPFICPLPGPAPFGPIGIGDIAVNRVLDTIWVTDGFLLGNYTPAGAPLSGFPVPPIGLGPITGLGFNSALGALWLCDGVMAAAILPPPPPGCFGPAPVVLVPPFPIPGPGPFTDIDWDPSTASLLASSVAGVVLSFVPPGIPGPFGLFPAALACPMGPLTGIAVDAAAPPGAGMHYVTGVAVLVARELPGGVPAPLTFYSPVPCYPAPAPLSGLAFAARAITYGVSVPAAGPTIAGVGQTNTPNPAFAIAVAGGPVPSVGLLVYSGAFACPALPVLGGLIYVGLPAITFAPIPGGGALVPAPIPPGLPVPASLYFQAVFFNLLTGTLATSPGLELGLSLP